MGEGVSKSQAAIRRNAYFEPGPGHQLPRRIIRRAWNLLIHNITAETHWVPGHSSIHRNAEADLQVNLG